MHVAIDIDYNRVIGVHRVQDILHGLILLECGNVRNVLFENTENPYFLLSRTEAQLRALFKNITGEDVEMDKLSYRAALTTAIDAMKPPLVDDQELEKQIASVEDQLWGKIGTIPFFRYVLGAKVPKVADGIVVRRIARDDKQREATKGAAQRLQAQAAPLTPATPAPRVARQALGVARPAGAPPTGGVAAEVWMVADKMWAEVGSPKDTKTVLALRIKMMQVLETEHDIKRTTASNTLGQWMKARLS